MKTTLREKVDKQITDTIAKFENNGIVWSPALTEILRYGISIGINIGGLQIIEDSDCIYADQQDNK